MPPFEAINKWIEVRRDRFTLTLFKREENAPRFEPIREYPIAVGLPDYPTPRGRYIIWDRAKDPEWSIPHSQWAIDKGLVAGTIVAGGAPDNPIRERWLGIWPQQGIGIHGTLIESSIGTRASHGCVRMLPDDVIDLYDRVPKHTPIAVR